MKQACKCKAALILVMILTFVFSQLLAAEPISSERAVKDTEYLWDKLKLPGTKFRFDGELYLITGPMTFSTAANFAALIKDVEVGTIVGKETGGLASSYSDIFKINLPNSGLNFGVTYKYFSRPAGFDNGRGV